MATVQNIRQYQVLITPLVDVNTYGTEVDVTLDVDMSEYVKEGGIGRIKGEIDNGDYDIGLFVYSDIVIKALNIDGKFNDENDWRSIFPFSRDRAKVTVNFLDVDGNTDITFRGITNEEATRQDFIKDEVRFKVLSQDSVIRKTKVAGGTVASGGLASDAIKSIINQPEITAILTYDPAKVTVGTDITIDDGSFFDNKTTKEALDLLMVATGSVMVIDSTSTMVVKDRLENTGSAFAFHGPGDVFGRQNIINISKLNTGTHRMFNSVRVNTVEVSDASFATVYTTRQKTVELDFITDPETEQTVAQSILDEFKVPKLEMEVRALTEDVRGLDMFDLVSVNYPYRTVPAEGEETLPLYGISKYGTAVYPIIQGNMKIREDLAFKVTGIKHNPKTFQTDIRLRQRGTTLSDGIFNAILSVYGSAIYGEKSYQLDPDRINPDTVNIYGGGLYGTVLYRQE